MRSINIFITLFCVICGTGFAEIKEASDISQLQDYFQNANSKTLAVFDIDLVLLQPSEPAFQMANIRRHQLVAKRVMDSLPPEKKDFFLTLMGLSSDPILVDEKIPELLEDLSQRGIPTIALTSNLTGSLSDVDNLEAWKVERLNNVGIDFAKSAPYKEEIVFNKLSSYRKSFSVYTQGVLFANGDVCPKGDVLIAFLEKGNLHPQKIIFVDDRLKNIKNVEGCLSKYDPAIQFEGIWFKGAEAYPSKRISRYTFQKKWEKLAAQASLLTKK